MFHYIFVNCLKSFLYGSNNYDPFMCFRGKFTFSVPAADKNDASSFTVYRESPEAIRATMDVATLSGPSPQDDSSEEHVE